MACSSWMYIAPGDSLDTRAKFYTAHVFQVFQIFHTVKRNTSVTSSFQFSLRLDLQMPIHRMWFPHSHKYFTICIRPCYVMRWSLLGVKVETFFLKSQVKTCQVKAVSRKTWYLWLYTGLKIPVLSRDLYLSLYKPYRYILDIRAKAKDTFITTGLHNCLSTFTWLMYPSIAYT